MEVDKKTGEQAQHKRRARETDPLVLAILDVTRSDPTPDALPAELRRRMANIQSKSQEFTAMVLAWIDEVGPEVAADGFGVTRQTVWRFNREMKARAADAQSPVPDASSDADGNLTEIMDAATETPK